MLRWLRNHHQGGGFYKVNYYNEFDPKAAAWLRELIKAGEIPNGVVDERSIVELAADRSIAGYLNSFTQCHFFAGIGGWSYALKLAGWPDHEPVWTGSCPCQPFSSAGKKAVQSDERHLWEDWFGIIQKCAPGIIFGEQVNAAIAAGWLDDAFISLEASDYACAAAVLPACSVRAKHRRHRVMFVAYAERHEQQRSKSRCWEAGRVGRKNESVSWDRTWRSALREFRALDDGISYGVEALDGPRNAIVPQVAAQFIQAFCEAKQMI